MLSNRQFAYTFRNIDGIKYWKEAIILNYVSHFPLGRTEVISKD
jgi:hypothetical protein